jgi:hypothetical protein
MVMFVLYVSFLTTRSGKVKRDLESSQIFGPSNKDRMTESGMDRDPNVKFSNLVFARDFPRKEKYATRETTFHHGPEHSFQNLLCRRHAACQ